MSRSRRGLDFSKDGRGEAEQGGVSLVNCTVAWLLVAACDTTVLKTCVQNLGDYGLEASLLPGVCSHLGSSNPEFLLA